MLALRSVADRHWFIAPLALALTGALFYALWVVRAEPIEALHNEITSDVRPGGFVVVQRTVRWLRSDCRGFISQAQFVDSLKPPRVHANPIPLRFGDLYGRTHFRTEWQVAFTMPWGRAIFQNRLSFGCFPFYGLWPVVVDLPDLPFQVMPPG